jgi:hypothetical protein
MTIKQVSSYYFLSVAVDIGRALVHIQDIPLGVADGDSDGQFLKVRFH